MPALRMMDIDGTMVIAIEDPRIAARMKAFGYVWQELDQHPKRTEVVVENLDHLYGELAALVCEAKQTGKNGEAT